MNKGERIFKDRMERLGWRIYRRGWPDFLLHKKMGEKDVICFVEVKSLTGVFTKDQMEVLELLGQLARTFVIHISDSGVFSKKNYEVMKSIDEYSQEVFPDIALREMKKKEG